MSGRRRRRHICIFSWSCGGCRACRAGGAGLTGRQNATSCGNAGASRAVDGWQQTRGCAGARHAAAGAGQETTRRPPPVCVDGGFRRRGSWGREPLAGRATGGCAVQAPPGRPGPCVSCPWGPCVSLPCVGLLRGLVCGLLLASCASRAVCRVSASGGCGGGPGRATRWRPGPTRGRGCSSPALACRRHTPTSAQQSGSCPTSPAPAGPNPSRRGRTVARVSGRGDRRVLVEA